MMGSQTSYALAIAALQAFNAPTTVQHISGLMAYMIWFHHSRQPGCRHARSLPEILEATHAQELGNAHLLLLTTTRHICQSRQFHRRWSGGHEHHRKP